MSFARIAPPVYETYQPGTPWHPGSSGWSRPFVPGWAQNPNLVGPPRKAVQGLGCGPGGCGCGGCKGVGSSRLRGNLGAYYPTQLVQPISGVGSYYERVVNMPVSGEDAEVTVTEGACPKGYHSAKAATIKDAVPIETDVCVKEQRWLYAGLGAVAGIVFAKLVL